MKRREKTTGSNKSNRLQTGLCSVAFIRPLFRLDGTVACRRTAFSLLRSVCSLAVNNQLVLISENQWLQIICVYLRPFAV